MRYTIKGKNISVTERLRAQVTEKIGKLAKYFAPDTEAIITLSVEKDRQRIEVTIPVKGSIIRAEQESSDMYVSIDLVEEIIERQIKRYKNKLVEQKRNALSFSQEFMDENYEGEDEIKVTRVKKFPVKPMDVEEACVQMELLGHTFFVFQNSDGGDVNVVYKRKDGTYGLIEPEF